jgi:predicted enzyme related to lactoylglutathione lyase
MADVPTRESRIALTVDGFDAAAAFYGQVLGLELAARWDQPAGNGGIFEIERATLEILDGRMAEGVDDLEVGRRVSGPVRIALGVTSVDATTKAATDAGAELLGPVQDLPWGDRVARVVSPHGSS